MYSKQIQTILQFPSVIQQLFEVNLSLYRAGLPSRIKVCKLLHAPQTENVYTVIYIHTNHVNTESTSLTPVVVLLSVRIRT